MTKSVRRLTILLGLIASCAMSASTAHAAHIGMECKSGTTFNLVAKPGYIETPDGNSVFNWSFAVGDPPGYTDGQFQEPGPVLCVNQGDLVTINLHNALGANTPVSIVFPGQDGQGGVTASGGVEGLFTREAPPAGDVTYTFRATQPGTYIYESGTNPSQQVEMGLYGALVVRPTNHADWAYGDASTQFDPSREFLIMLNELDPDLHHAVETGSRYDFNQLHNRYFAVNGREFPDTLQDNGVSWLPNQPYGALVRLQPYCNPTNRNDPSLMSPPGCTTRNVLPALIRMINVGAFNHPYHPHGNHLRQIAQDGRAFAAGASSEHFGETIGSGQTADYLLTWADQDFWDPTDPSRQFPNSIANIDYRNLTFKDNNTYFSGSAYLGLKGTLPTGVVSQNVCGEWYFPWHSHALNEFTNFDQGFGGMATLMRVDPLGGCFAYPTATTLVGSTLKSGNYSALGQDDGTYYQLNPKTTTLGSAMNNSSTTASITVGSAAGFPSSGSYYIQIGTEVMQVTGGQGTTTWTVCRTAACRLGTPLAAHASGATITAMANDWYAGFTGVSAGSQNFKLTYKGENCATTTGPACAPLSANLPQQTLKICNWTVAGATGCSTAVSSGWTTLQGDSANPNPRGVGSTDVSTTFTLPGSASAYIGTGANKGQVRVLVHTQRWTAPNPTPFSTWANFMKLIYDTP